MTWIVRLSTQSSSPCCFRSFLQSFKADTNELAIAVLSGLCCCKRSSSNAFSTNVVPELAEPISRPKLCSTSGPEHVGWYRSDHSAVLARISQRRCLSSLEGGGGGAKDGRKAPIFPWVLAGLTGSMTLYAAKVAESGDLFKSVVQEIHRAQGLQNLLRTKLTTK